MGHPTLSQQQATIVNVAALAFLSAMVLVGMSSSSSDDVGSGSDGKNGVASSSIARIDTQRIVNADKAPGDWLSHGRNYQEQRFRR